MMQGLSLLRHARRAGSLAGAVALVVMIWIAGPLIAFGTARPLEPVWVRIVLTVLILGGVAAREGWRYYQRRKQARQLEAGVAAVGQTESDAPVLADRMKDALATLRKAKGARGDYLYALPWYILIGPPGSGKTTALVNSGLKFPLQRDGGPASVEGVGGTRYCDWWFTEDAVLIDTAGRYTTQEADGGKGDRQSWLAFLDLLRRTRPRQPVNGVLIVISIEDLLTLPDEELRRHSEAIRTRLLELHDRLKVNFPVYALFTKADLIAGFREYYSDLREIDRRVVWGATFQTDERTRNMIDAAPAEFDLLIERLNERLSDRMQEEPNHRARVLLFGFPTQMMALRGPLFQFLNNVFEPTRYHANAMLRGFYFTSGTQEGTPIDQLIGAVAKTFEAGNLAQRAYSGRGKSFFLTDLINKVILGEAGWVSVNRAAAQRAWFGRAVIYTAVAVLAAVCVSLWSISFYENRRLIAESTNQVRDIQLRAGSVLRQTSIGDYEFRLTQEPALNPLRAMPAGYATRDTPIPRKERLGLSQRDRLEAASVASYHRVLERTLRPRLIVRLEEQLKAQAGNPDFVYVALKVYMMLGGLRKSDEELIAGWMRRDWAENLYPGSQFATSRQRLEDHVRAMLALDFGGEPRNLLSETVIADAQKSLARMSVADRAYQLLKSDAGASGVPDWVLVERAGADAVAVFETIDGATLDSVRVPGFFTYEGFHRTFLARLDDVESRLAADAWLLGALAEQTAYTDQYLTLRRDLQARYKEEFFRVWSDALARLQLQSLTADKPFYSTLYKTTTSTSPIRSVLASVRNETALNVARAAPQAKDALPALAGAANGAAAPEPALSFDALPDESDTSAQEIAIFFSRLGALAEGEANATPIDAVLADLAKIHANLIAAKDAAQSDEIHTTLLKQIADLRTKASALPKPVSNWILEAAADIENDVTNSSIAQLQQLFNEQVARKCQQMTGTRYPFTANSSQDVQWLDFTLLFQPGGIIDKFFTERLAPLVDTSGTLWAWRQTGGLAETLSAESLRQFQRAAEIRETFFAAGTEPSISFIVTPAPLGTGVTLAKMKINFAIVEGQQGLTVSQPVEWPGPTPDNTAEIVVQSGQLGQEFRQVRFSGPWALFRMLDAGTLARRGDGVVFTADVQGVPVTYEISFNSIRNPFLLPALREFRCPTGL